jgi:hypothetical protein
VTAAARIIVSLAFLALAFLAGSLAHSTAAFTAIMAVGFLVGLILRLAR